MAPKPQSSDAQVEHALQAVVVADAMDIRFRPLTLTRPRCLLPLANVPLLEYTLEFLEVAGVEETFIFCKSHSDQIRDYIKQSKIWSPGGRSSMKIQVILAPEAFGVGDVLRELDGKGWIKTDFILVSGDVISNMKLDRVLEEHRQRRVQNKDAIMTMVMKRAAPQHRSRDRAAGAVVAIDPKNNELLHYERLPAYPRKKRVSVPMESLAKRSVFQFHNDWIDCQIDICSVDVPALFTENFDYHDMRRDFVNGILTSDLLSNTIHVHVLSEQYACRVDSTQLYDAICRDVIARWTFPMVPDSNLGDYDDYQYVRGHIYKAKNVVLARSSVLERNAVIGSGTRIGESTEIRHSTIGRNCTIGANVIIEGSYIWDNAVIESNCVIRNSIVGHDCVVKPCVSIERGCIVGDGVTLGPNITMEPFTKVTIVLPEPGDIYGGVEFKQPTEYDTAILGAEAEGYVWNDKWDEEDDEEEEEDERNKLARSIGFLEPDAFTLTPDDESNADTISFRFSDEESDEEELYETEDDLTRSYQEAADTVHRAITENHQNFDNAVLELNALKMAYNMSFHDLRASCIPALLEHLAKKKTAEEFRVFVERWGGLIGRFMNSEEDQVDGLTICMESCARMEDASKVFLKLITNLYQVDVLEEDAIVKWFHTKGLWEDADVAHESIRQAAGEFVKWLQTAESESDEEESEEEEED